MHGRDDEVLGRSEVIEMLLGNEMAVKALDAQSRYTLLETRHTNAWLHEL